MAGETQNAGPQQGLQDPQASGSPAAPGSPAEYVSRGEWDGFKKEVLAAIDSQGERTRKSQRDVIQDRVSKAVGEALPYFDTVADSLKPLLKEGADVGAAKREFFVSGLMAEPSQQAEQQAPAPSQGQPQPAGTGSSAIEAEIQQILQRFKLTGTEPELAEYVKANQGKPWYEAGPGFFQLAEKVGTRSGTMLGAQGQAPPSQDVIAEYTKQMNELYTRSRKGEIRGVEARTALQALRREYKAKGVPVDQIFFGAPGTQTFADSKPV